MDIGACFNYLQQHIDQSAVVEISLEELEFRSLENCLHTSNSSVVIGVDLHHFNEVLVCFETMDVFWNQRQQITKNGEAMNLKLLELRWLPSV